MISAVSPDASLTLLLVKVTVDISLHFGVVPVTHPGQMFAGDSWTGLVVESSGLRNDFMSKPSTKIQTYKKLRFCTSEVL